MAEIIATAIAKRYGATTALDDVTLHIREGELIALLGPSGCGKTTLLRAVAGLLAPDTGRILIGGADMTALPARERPIGMVFQSFALFPNMTVRENVGFPLKVKGEARAAIDRRVEELLALVQLAALGGRYPKQISAGQQQRVALARALARAPQVLLLDEPLSALDALVRIQLRDEIRRIQLALGTTTIFVTHDQSEAMAVADRVAVMNRGRIEQLAPPIEIYDRPATPFSAGFVGSRNALELPVRDGMARFGAAFAVPAPRGANGRVVAFFRPEDVDLVEGGAGQPATVEVRIFLGATTRLHLVAPVDGLEARLYADVPTRQALQLERGAALSVRIDPGSVQAFPL